MKHSFVNTLMILYSYRIIGCNAEISSTINTFINWHTSFDVGGLFQDIYRPQNNVSTGINGSPIQSIDFQSGLQQLKYILGQVGTGRRIRAYGSKWSMSNIAYVDDILVETWGLNYYKIGIENSTYLTPRYQNKSDHLVFIQSGVMVKHLSKVLEENGLSIFTSGTSDGQRVVGAISTGSHGSAPYYGDMGEFVRGIHIVISGTEHYFIQRESDAIVTQVYATEYLIGATLVENNELFEAAIVGLGSFGIIHAMLIEVEPVYLLRTQYSVVDYHDIKQGMSSMDVSSFGLDGISKVPYYIKFILNPYNLKKTYINVAEKVPPASVSELKRFASKDDDFFIEDPMVTLIVNTAKDIKSLRILDVSFKGLFRPIGNVLRRFTFSRILDFVGSQYMRVWEKGTMRTAGSIFTEPEQNSRTYSSTAMEIAVPVEYTAEVIDISLEIMRNRPVLQQIVVRYVKGSSSMFTFAPFNMTATIDFYGVWTDGLFNDVQEVYRKIFDAMAETSIPHCYHWGKKLPATSNWIVDSCYGIERRDAWIRQRELFLVDPSTRYKFSSDTIEFLGLNS